MYKLEIRSATIRDKKVGQDDIGYSHFPDCRFYYDLVPYPLIKTSKAVCRWLTSCCRIAMAKAFRVPTKTANVLALVNPV